MADMPLVSIGIPTYNRVSHLKRTIESALLQDYPNLEIMISDNASTDGTQELCQHIAEKDARVNYVRQPINRGMTFNFKEVLRHSQGDFFMWLGDDDYLSQSYVSQCMKALTEQPEYAMVGGKALYYRGGNLYYEGKKINLLQDTGTDRVISYYSQVTDNGVFYSIMRRSILTQLPILNTMGGDWLLIASLAFLGKVLTLETISINRDTKEEQYQGGGYKKLAQRHNFGAFQGDYPHLSISISAFNDIAWMSPAYTSLGEWGRISLAWDVQRIVCQRHRINLNSNLLLLLNYLDRCQKEPLNQSARTDLEKQRNIISTSHLAELSHKLENLFVQDKISVSAQNISVTPVNKNQVGENIINPQSVNRLNTCAIQFRQNPLDQTCLTTLRQERHNLAGLLINMSQEEIAAAYLSDIGEAYNILLSRGIQSAPLTREEQTFANDIMASLQQENSPDIIQSVLTKAFTPLTGGGVASLEGKEKLFINGVIREIQNGRYHLKTLSWLLIVMLYFPLEIRK